MEQPVHTLRDHLNSGRSGAAATQRRLGGFAVVVLVHIGIIVLLIVGMKSGEIAKKLEDIKVAVEKDKTPPKTPPPPPPDLVKPPPPFVPPPMFEIAADAPATNAITTTTNPPRVAPPPAPSAPPPTKFEIIRSSTIEKPPYPELSQRLGEKGDVILTLTIGIDGKVSDVAIQKSSGFPRLDEAAASWVKGHWRFKPPTQNGQPVDGAKMSLRYQWVLPS